MTGAVPYWHVDAFAERPFTGNQAAVMLFDDWPDDRLLQDIAAENNFAETAFVVGASDPQPDLRWFTPTTEIRLCGHATLAAGHILLEKHPARPAINFRTRLAGLLEVRRSGGGYELALPAIRTVRHEWPEAAAALGKRPMEIRRNPDGYTLLLYEDEATVRALSPDFARLAEFGPEVFATTAPGSATDVVSRVFVPGAGVDEDSVTGAAHAMLTPFWAARLGRESFTAYQASARGGHIACRLDGDRAWLGGGCVTVVEGSFLF